MASRSLRKYSWVAKLTRALFSFKVVHTFQGSQEKTLQVSKGNALRKEAAGNSLFSYSQQRKLSQVFLLLFLVCICPYRNSMHSYIKALFLNIYYRFTRMVACPLSHDCAGNLTWIMWFNPYNTVGVGCYMSIFPRRIWVLGCAFLRDRDSYASSVSDTDD